MLLHELLDRAGLSSESQYTISGWTDNALTNVEIREIFCDSRKVVSGGLYIAMEGLHTDSHGHLYEAYEHGAVAAVVCRSAMGDGRADTVKGKIPLIAVDDTRRALAWLYAAWYDNPQSKMKFIGVTGTNGKTSVCSMIYHILTGPGRRCGIIGTTGSAGPSGELAVKPDSPVANMTTPDPPELYKTLDLMQKDGVEYVIMEVTSHALALSKVDPIFFDLAVFTNLTEDHLDFHLNMQEYYEAKARLFSKCRTAIINVDDAFGADLAKDINCERLTCSADGRTADFNAYDMRWGTQIGVEYRLSSYKMRLRIRCRIPGQVTVMNTMQAAVAAHVCGVAPREIKESLCSFEGIKGRLERLKIDGRCDISVYIDYAHTPDALENLLRTARRLAKRGQRVVLLFGCGGDREVQKRAVMGRIASQMADFFVLTSDNCRSERPIDIISDIIAGVCEGATYTVIENRRDAIEYVIKNARKGDIIILAGKGHEEYEIDSRGRHPFSERALVAEFVRKYYD